MSILTPRAMLACAIAVLACSPALAQPTSAAKTVDTVQSSARQAVAGSPSLQVFTAAAGQPDLCIGEVSGAYGNAMLAVTLDFPRRDRECALLRKSKWAAEIGEADLAREIMCADADWRRAAARVGRPCLTTSTAKER